MTLFKTLSLLLILTPFALFSQENENNKTDEVPEVDLFFNEFTVSANMSMVQNSNTKNGFGGGFGIYRSWRNDKIVNIVHGIEYNYTSQTKNRIYEGSSYAYYDNALIKMHNISIPVAVRFTFGQSTKLFIETGAFMDFNVSDRRKGVYKTTDGDGIPMDVVVDEDANLDFFNYGFNAGLGARVPVKGLDLLFKVDYKFGIPDLYRFDEKVYNRYLRFSFGVNLR